MRRALNVLQACHAAYERIGETEIYTCTGSPHPSDIEAIINSMLSEEFTASHQSEHSYFTLRARRLPRWWPEINALKIDRGLALQDLLAGAYEYVDAIEFPPAARVYLLDQLATTESVVFCQCTLLHTAHQMTDIGCLLEQMKRSN